MESALLEIVDRLERMCSALGAISIMLGIIAMVIGLNHKNDK